MQDLRLKPVIEWAMFSKRRKIYEGKSKALYEGPDGGTLIQHFKDDATAFDNKKHAIIEGRGVLNNRISEHLFKQLNQMGINTHFIRSLNMREQLIHRLEIIPVEVIVRNIAAGSLSQRLGWRRVRLCRALSLSFATSPMTWATLW